MSKGSGIHRDNRYLSITIRLPRPQNDACYPTIHKL